MSPDTTPPSGPSRARRLLRALTAMAAVAAVLAGLAAGVLATGYPQQAGLRWAAERALGVPVEVGATSVLGALRVDRLSIRPDRAPDAPPLFSTDGLRVEYVLRPPAGRHIPSVRADRVGLHLDATNPAAPNFGFLLGREADPDFDIAPYLPETLNIDRADIGVLLPGMGLELRGLRLASRAPSLETVELTADSRELGGRLWYGTGPTEIPLDGATLAVSLTRDHGRVSSRIACAVPGQGEVELEGEAGYDGDTITFDVRTPRLLITRDAAEDDDAPRATPRLPLLGLAAQGRYDTRTKEYRLSVESTPFPLVSPEGESLFFGAPDFELEGAGGSFRFVGGVGPGLRVEGTVSSGDDRAVISARLPDWPVALLSETAPVFAPYLAYAPHVTAFGADIEATYAAPEYTVALHARPSYRGRDGAARRLDARVTGGGTTEPEARRLFEGAATIALERGDLEAALRVESLSEMACDVTIRQATWGELIHLAAGRDLVEGFDAVLSGKASVSLGDDGPVVAADLVAAQVAYGALSLADGEPVALTGDAAWTRDRLSGRRLVARCGDSTTITLADWSVTPEPFAAAARLEGAVDVGEILPSLREQSVWGQFEAKGPVRYADGVAGFTFDVSSTGFGKGGFATPYGAPVTARGALEYDTAAGRAQVRELEVDYGEGTRLTSPQAVVVIEPFSAEAPFSLTTDLRPLVDMGVLDSVDGRAVVTGTGSYGETVRLDCDFRLDAPLLVLGDAMAGLSGVEVEGRLRAEEALSGAGRVRVDRAAAAGAALHNVAGPLEANGRTVRFGPFTGDVFGGAVSGDAYVELAEAGPVIRIEARLERVDLARFTEEMKPPGVKLTGIADGELEVVWSTRGIEDLRVALRCSENLTVNRDLLEQLLLTHYVKDVAGLGGLDRVRAQVIGKAEQRPFDGAELELGWAVDELKGQVRLKSRELSLTVDLTVDAEALAEAIRLQQETRLKDIQGIRADPWE